MSKAAKLVSLIALLLVGTAAGVGLGLRTAWLLELRSGEYALMRYAHSLLHVMEASAIEARHVYTAVSDDKLAFCSDDELALMRRQVYDATFVKDIGKIKDGMLVCTSSLGRLPRPVPQLAPSLSFQSPDSMFHVEIASSHQLLFAPGPTGLVVASKGVSVVLNPALYSQLDDPPMQFTGLLYDHEHKIVMYGAGHSETLPTAEVIAQKPVEHEGLIYQPLCSTVYAACVVGVEPRSEMISRNPAFLVGFAAGGGLLGLSITSTVLLFFRRQGSFERRLRRAIRSRKLFCVYQPIFALDTGKIVGAEALARWTNELGERVPPDAFIPVAEDKGFVGEITRLVMECVVADLRPLLAEPGFHVSVNITPQDLSDPAFFAHLASIVAQSSVPPGALAFELTERSRTDQTVAKAAISQLRSAGHIIYIDDFGTGYSSLSYLHDLHVDAIKIDRVFTQTIGTEAITACVLPQIVYMASRLGLTVVVEGVETEEQADYFRHAASGVLGQGWFLGMPIPADEFKSLFEAHRAAGSESVQAVDNKPVPLP